MAGITRFNRCHVFGMMMDEAPRIIKQDGKIISVNFHLAVLRDDERKVEDGRALNQADFIYIMVHNPAMYEKAASFRMYDMVEAEGFMRTNEHIRKTAWCPKCNTPTVWEGTLTYILAKFCACREHAENLEEGTRLLLENRMVSNVVTVYAKLVNEPRRILTKTGVRYTQYQAAIGRTYYDTSDPGEKSDYIVIRSYGNMGEYDYAHLQTGSEIIVDGYVQARKARKTIHCNAPVTDPQTGKPLPELNPVTGEPLHDPQTGKTIPKICGHTYSVEDEVSEIVVYAPKYVSGLKEDP